MHNAQPIKIFCSYAHEDQIFVHQLRAHFASIQRRYHSVLWTDLEVQEGEEWEATILKHLNTAQIILLLISSDFMNSEYCYHTEMPRAMERHNQKEARVIPILIRSVARWQDAPFGKLQILPADGKPITHWHATDDAFAHVIEKISHVVSELARKNEDHINPEQSSIIASTISVLQQSALPLPLNSSALFEMPGSKSFEHQEEAYDFLISMIRRYGAKEAVFIQYSCNTSMPVLRRLLRAGAEVTVFIQHEETATKIGSQFQADRIISAARNLRSNLGDSLLDPQKLKVYKYRPPCSMSAIKIDNRVLYMGWYTYELKEPSGEGDHPDDIIDFSGHDRAAIVAWQRADNSQASNTLEEVNDFQALAKTFNMLEQNYRKYAEIVPI